MAGACGGITTIYEMPNCNPAVYNVDKMNDLIEVITPKAFVDFGVWGLCLGPLNNHELAAMNKAGVVGFKFFWGYAIDSKTYQLIYNYKEGMENVIPPLDLGEVYKIFREVAKTGKMLGIHAEDFDVIKLLTAEVKASGETDYAAMLRSRPVLSETLVIETAIQLSKELGTHLHILHLACGDGVDLIREAQKKGIHVTGETCPHYLALTDQDAAELGARSRVILLSAPSTIRTSCGKVCVTVRCPLSALTTRPTPWKKSSRACGKLPPAWPPARPCP